MWSSSGGGCSATQEKKPPWQHDKTCKYRLGNDVSAVGAIEVAEYDTYGYGGWIEVGGTSIGSPLLAGVFALAGNSTKQDGGRTFWILWHHRFLYVVSKKRYPRTRRVGLAPRNRSVLDSTPASRLVRMRHRLRGITEISFRNREMSGNPCRHCLPCRTKRRLR